MRLSIKFLGAIAGGLASVLPFAAFSEPLQLGMPVACELGVNCFVQSHVDLDPSANARDYRCGSATYNGHKGTDFRLLSTAATQRNVLVLATAAGRVKGVRDGVPDRLIGRGVKAPHGRECGNGVVIDHGNGWETQYCHLLRGSVRVRRGQRVARGANLGAIGFSGKAAFAHLHISVRKDGRVIDPYSNATVGGQCGPNRQRPLWSRNIAMPYAGSQLLDGGFTDKAVASRQTETGELRHSSVTADSNALVFYVRYINLRANDQVRLLMRGPAGFHARNRIVPLRRHKARYVAFVGKKLRASRWPSGTYAARTELIRNGRKILTRVFRIQIR